ncbi:MAG TPA: AMP-binding protein, partial [Micromonosporaceae bacterium]|nr:AMP-binding protein [Micromonosporaceae bacterium]
MRVQLGAAREGLSGLPDGRGLNIAYEAVDRHLLGESRDAVALRCLGRRGEVEDITYAELSRRTNRFANLLVGLGVQRGERVFALLPRRADLYVTVLGTLKRGAVLS